MISGYIYVAKIVKSTSVDGVGLRNSLYVSGCNIHCPGCHNKELWPLESGTAREIEEIADELLEDGANVSILGGEPLMQYEAVVELCRMLKNKSCDCNIWLYTGYTLSHVKLNYPHILEFIDTIVDGPYIQEQRTTESPFIGSTNQTITNVKNIISENIQIN